jgi:hypothetical protein
LRREAWSNQLLGTQHGNDTKKSAVTNATLFSETAQPSMHK